MPVGIGAERTDKIDNASYFLYTNNQSSMITKSAQKAYRQNITRRARNEKRKQLLKKILKSYKKLVAAGKMDEAKTELANVYQALDKTAKAGVIKPNKAARLKSRLTKLLTQATK